MIHPRQAAELDPLEVQVSNHPARVRSRPLREILMVEDAKGVGVEVNKDAPAVATGEIEIRAKPEVVWDVLADIDNWPSWNPDVKEARLMGGLRLGSVFRWKSGPGTITSALGQVDRPREIGWRGKTMGINAEHVYKLESHAEGTKVYTEESFDGLIARLFRGSMRKTLQKGIDGGLASLKKEAERLSDSASH